MDLNTSDGFFEHESAGVNLAGYNFKVKSKWGRGQTESFSVNYIADTKDDLGVFSETLDKFVSKIKQVKNIYKSVYRRSVRKDAEIPRTLDKLKQQAQTTFKECKQIEQDLIYGHVLVIGLDNVGKTTITNKIINIDPHRAGKSAFGLKVLRNVIENTVFDVYDLYATQDGACYEEFVIPDAIIFVMECYNDLNAYDDSVYEFNLMMDHFFGDNCVQPLELETPILILINKAELCQNKSDLKDKLLKKLNPDVFNINCEIFFVSAEEDAGIIESFSWLVTSGLNN